MLCEDNAACDSNHDDRFATLVNRCILALEKNQARWLYQRYYVNNGLSIQRKQKWGLSKRNGCVRCLIGPNLEDYGSCNVTMYEGCVLYESKYKFIKKFETWANKFDYYKMGQINQYYICERCRYELWNRLDYNAIHS